MGRTKVYTSEGQVIWVAKSDGRSSNARQPERTPEVLFEFHDLEQPQELSDVGKYESEYVEEVVLEDEMAEHRDDAADQGSLQTFTSHRGATKARVTDLRYNLAKWSSTNRVSNDAMDDLLGLLKKHRVPGLPDSSTSLQLYLKSDKSTRAFVDSDSDQSDNQPSPDRSNASRVNRKRSVGPEQNTLSVDVSDLTELFNKMDVIDRKLDMLTENGEAHSEMLRHVLTEIASVKASASVNKGDLLDYEDTTRRIVLPVESQAKLDNLEIFSKQREGRAALRKTFNDETSNDPYDFLRTNVDRVFMHAEHYSWTGKIAHNAKYEKQMRAACNLNIIRILIDVTMQRFNISRDDCIQKIVKVFQNFNAKLHARQKRAKEGINTPPKVPNPMVKKIVAE